MSAQEIKGMDLEEINAKRKLTGIFEVEARKLLGTETCQLLLPCRYDGKKLTVIIYE